MYTFNLFNVYYQFPAIFQALILEMGINWKKKLIKVLVSELCLTLCYCMDCSFCQWNSPGKNTEVDSHSLPQGIFPTQGSNLCLLHCKWILYSLSHQGSPAAAAAAKSLQSCPTLCDPIDGSPPGSAVPGILQARSGDKVPVKILPNF